MSHRARAARCPSSELCAGVRFIRLRNPPFRPSLTAAGSLRFCFSFMIQLYAQRCGSVNQSSSRGVSPPDSRVGYFRSLKFGLPHSGEEFCHKNSKLLCFATLSLRGCFSDAKSPHVARAVRVDARGCLRRDSQPIGPPAVWPTEHTAEDRDGRWPCIGRKLGSQKLNSGRPGQVVAIGCRCGFRRIDVGQWSDGPESVAVRDQPAPLPC